jgi:hypothetical protein
MPADKVRRDCKDFRPNTNVAYGAYCEFSKNCTGPTEQKMFVDTYFRYEEGRNACLGVNNDSKLPMLRKICTGSPIRLTREQLKQIEKQRKRIGRVI